MKYRFKLNQEQHDRVVIDNFFYSTKSFLGVMGDEVERYYNQAVYYKSKNINYLLCENELFSIAITHGARIHILEKKVSKNGISYDFILEDCLVYNSYPFKIKFCTRFKNDFIKSLSNMKIIPSELSPECGA